MVVFACIRKFNVCIEYIDIFQNNHTEQYETYFFKPEFQIHVALTDFPQDHADFHAIIQESHSSF